MICKSVRGETFGKEVILSSRILSTHHDESSIRFIFLKTNFRIVNSFGSIFFLNNINFI